MSNTTTPATSTITREATTREVRSWFNDTRYGASRRTRLVSSDEKFGEKAAHTVTARPNLRGRLHPLAVAMFNEAHAKKGVAYVSGATARGLNEARATRDNLRAAAAEKGLAVSDKGPLSNEAKAALIEAGLIEKPVTKTRKGK